MFNIKREEYRQRKEIEENPYKMKMLLKDVEKKIKHKEKSKKEKKHKHKHKKHRKHSSSSSRTRSPSQPRVEFKTPSLTNLKLCDTPSIVAKNLITESNTSHFGLVDKNGKKLEITSKRDLRPDESLYRDRQTLIEKETELRKQKALKDRINVKELSNVEREKLIKEMEIKAKVLDYQKQLKVDEPKLRKKKNPAQIVIQDIIINLNF